MKTTTTKIRFTEPQIALVMRAHPNCNLDHLTEVSFEFDQIGKIIDASALSRTAGILITIMPVAGWRACTREHVANSQLDKLALRYCNFQTARACQRVEMIPRKLQAPEMHQVSKAPSNEQRDGLNRSV
jgi:hypothetical protein